MGKTWTLILGLLLVAPGIAAADELSITPGLWEFTTVSVNPVNGQEMTQTETECVVEESVTPAQFMPEIPGCSVGESGVDGSTLTFEMSCSADGQNVTVRGQIQSNGDNVEGGLEIEMSFGGQSMTSETSYSGNRVSDC